MGQPRPLFVYFSSFNNKFSVNFDFGGIRTQIVGVVGEHADHLTITTRLQFQFIVQFFIMLFPYDPNGFLVKQRGWNSRDIGKRHWFIYLTYSNQLSFVSENILETFFAKMFRRRKSISF